jgi:Domain of unknown function (DUF4126)
MDILTGLTLAAPAGLNAYIPLLVLGIAGRLNVVELTGPYTFLEQWWMLGLMAILLAVEIIADKVPAVDTVNDAIQTVVRPVAGGLLAVSAAGVVKAPAVVLFVAGVLLAGSVHAAKASARPAVNVATGGAGAPVVSAIEDVASLVLSVLAILVPLFAAITIGVMVFLLWRLAKRLVAAAKGRKGETPPPPIAPT